MNNRTITMWVPALINLAASMSFLVVLQQLGLRPQMVWVAQMPMSFYVPWLIALPLFGGVSAYVSRRSGGTFLVSFLAGLFPAVVLSCLVCFALSELAIKRLLDRPCWLCVGVTVINWVVLPAVALLVGVLSFLRRSKDVWIANDQETTSRH